MIKRCAIILLLATFQIAAYAQFSYQLDVKKSRILWNNSKSMGGHYGYILFNSGSLNYSAAGDPVNGVFSLDMNNMKSTDHTKPGANQKVDKELRKPGFFDTDHYPSSAMVVKQIIKAGNANSFKVRGNLTIKRITKQVEFMATIKPQGNTINIKAELSIDRQQWDIDMQPDANSYSFLATIKDKVISPEIGISLNLVMLKKAAAK